MSSVRNVIVLGATGSIGRSTLNVIRRHPGRFRPLALAAASNASGLDELALEFDPDFVVLAHEPPAGFKPRWSGEWRVGEHEVVRAAATAAADTVVNAVVGFAGLEATLAALTAGKRLALANKESLVAGGALVLDAWRGGTGELLPVDSEHSAIFQCLQSRPVSEVRRIILTASGGPFRSHSTRALQEVTRADALAHPIWDMGDKVTVDSATLANKALEVIEAHLLFGVGYDRIEVLVHPSSVVHSMVEFRDGSTIAQLSNPSMEVPIQYALSFPERLENEFVPLDLVGGGPLSFEDPRRQDFPLLELGVDAGRQGGVMPAVFNAANEVAVAAFLDGALDFQGISAIVGDVLIQTAPVPVGSLERLREIDARARLLARIAIQARSSGTSHDTGCENSGTVAAPDLTNKQPTE
ncbi:MAG: 1-deoxy-D-xylulose-5-phosphate reductoisomerase [Gemmatimonadota bacterium]